MRKPEGRLYLNKKKRKKKRAKGSQGRDSSWRNSDPKMVRFQRLAVQCLSPSKVKEISFRETDLAEWGWASGLGNLKFWRFPAKGLSIQPCTLSSPSAFSFIPNEETNLLAQQQRKLTSVTYKQSSPRKT